MREGEHLWQQIKDCYPSSEGKKGGQELLGLSHSSGVAEFNFNDMPRTLLLPHSQATLQTMHSDSAVYAGRLGTHSTAH